MSARRAFREAVAAHRRSLGQLAAAHEKLAMPEAGGKRGADPRRERVEQLRALDVGLAEQSAVITSLGRALRVRAVRLEPVPPEVARHQPHAVPTTPSGAAGKGATGNGAAHNGAVGHAAASRTAASRAPSGVPAAVDPPNVAEAHREFKAAREHLDDAERLGRRPAILPGWPRSARHALIYLCCALIALLAQTLYLWLAFELDDVTRLGALITLVVIPAASLTVGILLVESLGMPRIRPDDPDATRRRSVRLGAVLCFGVAPLALLVLILRARSGG